MFEEIPGQERAQRILQGAIKNKRIPHAYLFSGPQGVGKEITARSLAQTLNCQKKGIDACGECLACRKIINNNHPDLIIISPQGSGIKIDQIRELRQLIRYGPSEGPWLISIILEADLMTQEAANSILKVLEEPPDKVLFVLLTSREKALPQTITSRCQKVLFTEIPKEEALEDEKIRWLQGEFKDLGGKDVVELLSLAQKLTSEETPVENYLEMGLYWYWERWLKEKKKNLLKAINIIMGALKDIKKRANLRLTLEVMFLKLREVFSG